MSTYSVRVQADATEQEIRRYKEHKHVVTGMLEVGGDLGGGILSFLLSLSSGVTINGWNDLNGAQFLIDTVETRIFKLPFINMSSGQVRIYYTLVGATNPDFTITIGDNT